MKLPGFKIILVLLLCNAVLFGCSSSSLSNNIDGFFGEVIEKFPDNTGVKYAQLIKHTEVLGGNSEYHLVGKVDGGLFGELGGFMGSEVDIQLHIFDTSTIYKNSHQSHSYTLKASISNEDSSIRLAIDAELLLLFDEKNKEYYVFVQELEYDKKGNGGTVVDIRVSLLKSQTRKRLKFSSVFPIDILQSGYFINTIDSNDITKREMQGLDGSSIFTSSGNDLETSLQIFDAADGLSLTSLLYDSILILKGNKDGYSVEGTVKKDLYAGDIRGNLRHSVGGKKSLVTSDITVDFPKGLSIKIDSRETLQKKSQELKPIQLPKRFINIESLLSDRTK